MGLSLKRKGLSGGRQVAWRSTSPRITKGLCCPTEKNI